MTTRWLMSGVMLLLGTVIAGCDGQGETYHGGDGSDASVIPVDPNIPDSTLDGCHLFGQDWDTTYLGEWGTCFGSDSICNDFGKYGSEFALDGIFNDFSQFGSEFGLYSAWNKFCTKPPLMVCDGEVVGCVTVNPYTSCDGTRYHPGSLCSCL